MKVISPLANLTIYIGTIKRYGHNLYIVASDKSSLPVKIILSPRDIVSMLVAAIKSPQVWLFILLFPFYWLCDKKQSKQTPQKSQKHSEDPDAPDTLSMLDDESETINKPW